MLLNILQCTGQLPPPNTEQWIIWSKASLGLRLRNPSLEDEGMELLCWNAEVDGVGPATGNGKQAV